MLLNNQWITEESKEEIKKYLETNENRNTEEKIEGLEPRWQSRRTCSLSPARAPRSQLAAGQSSTGGHWNSPKKIPNVQGQRRSQTEMAGGAQSQ